MLPAGRIVALLTPLWKIRSAHTDWIVLVGQVKDCLEIHARLDSALEEVAALVDLDRSDGGGILV